ncbi:30S ribosomal protein S3 (plastid) [Lotharella oceanica]|uniref:Small ribosomal subunit protein uS3c n=1 Tax=Lotharella oceanica TaxID=641309 RepID=A0A059SL73_9EUKA|nr:30S ribosomal protein S3 [Lotharella oceanica]
MGQKVHPLGFRVSLNENYQSNWFVKPDIYHILLSQDYVIRQNIYQFFDKISHLKNKKSLSDSLNITDINISRKFDQINICISVAALSPLIESKKINSIITTLQLILIKKLEALSSNKLNYLNSPKIVINVKQSDNANISAIFIARCLVNELENRVRFRKALKSIIRSVSKQDKENKLLGLKIKISGRLNGIEMARSEWIKKGRIPLQTISANIDYCNDIARTKYGILGVKVWVCKEK